MKSTMKASVQGAWWWSLCCGLGLALYTAWFNRFDRFLDVVVLWLYVQIPLVVAAAAGGILIDLAGRVFDRVKKLPSTPAERSILAFSLLTSGTVAFMALSAARANLWYTRTYPWVDTWGDMLVVVLASFVGVLLCGLFAFFLVRKLSQRLGLFRDPKCSWRIRIGSVGLLCVLILGITGLAGQRNQVPAQPDRLPDRSFGSSRVVLVGIDGMIPEIVESMMAAGELPVFSRIADHGYYGRLRSTQPTNSPVIWTSIATGVQRYQHGVMNFLVQHPRGMKNPIRTFPSHMGLNTTFLLRSFYGSGLVQTYPVSGDLRRAATIWEIASAYGLRCGVVNWWPSWPARELNGFIVSDTLNEHVALFNKKREELDARGQTGPLDEFGFTSESEVTWPPSLADEIRERVDRERWSSTDDVHLMELGLELFDRFDPNLFMIYLHGPDMVQHLRWNAFEPELYRHVDADYIEEFRDAIPDAYRTADRLVGDLLAQLGDETTVIVVSDHGASPVFSFLSFWGYVAGHEHGPPGVLLAMGPTIRADSPQFSGSVMDIAPTILRLLGIVPSASMEGGVLEEMLTRDFHGRVDESFESWDFLAQQEFVVPPSDVSKEKEDALKALGYIN